MNIKLRTRLPIHRIPLTCLLLAGAALLFLCPNQAVAKKDTDTYDIVIGKSVSTEYYLLSEIKNAGSILVDGDVVMVVTGDITLSGKNSITISATGSLRLYFGGDIDLTGQAIANNGKPSQLVVLGTHAEPAADAKDNEVSQFKVTGNASFCGVLYAPNARLTANGGGSDELDLSGGIIVRKITFKGKMTFHGDEQLKETDFDLGNYELANYALLQAGAKTASSEATTIFGSSDYDSLFESLFESN